MIKVLLGIVAISLAACDGYSRITCSDNFDTGKVYTSKINDNGVVFFKSEKSDEYYITYVPEPGTICAKRKVK